MLHAETFKIRSYVCEFINFKHYISEKYIYFNPTIYYKFKKMEK